jgi:FkbM family methyltransferase
MNTRSLLAHAYVAYLRWFPVKRGKRRLSNLVGPYLIDVPVRTSYGFLAFARFHDNANRRMYERHNDRVIGFIYQLPVGSCFLDVGANQGETAILASRRVGPRGLVIAFEPGHAAFDVFLRNVELNGLRNVRLYQQAISPKEQSLFLAVDNPNHSGLAHVADHGEPIIAGPVDANPRVLELLISREVFVKIDTEGYELEVLRGLRSLLKSGKVRSLVIEVDEANLSRFGASSHALYEELTGLGYKPRFGLSEGHYDEIFDRSLDLKESEEN